MRRPLSVGAFERRLAAAVRSPMHVRFEPPSSVCRTVGGLRKQRLFVLTRPTTVQHGRPSAQIRLTKSKIKLKCALHECTGASHI